MYKKKIQWLAHTMIMIAKTEEEEKRASLHTFFPFFLHEDYDNVLN